MSPMHAARTFRSCIAAALLASALVAGGTALAGDAASKPAGAAATPQVTLDPEQLVVPRPSDDVSKFTPDTPGEDKAGLAIPNKIDLGTSQLRFDADRKAIDTGPRVGIDAVDPTVLNPNLPQRKQSPMEPYVGFTLSKPTN